MSYFGDLLTRPTQWLNAATAQARRMGKVMGPGDFGIANGFLFDGGMLGARFARLPFFASTRFGIRKNVVFDGMFDDRSRDVTSRPVQELVRNERLRYAIHLLERWPGTVPELVAAPARPQPGHFVFIIGYPMGGGLKVSLADNRVLPPPGTNSIPEHLYYRLPESPGSSGSAIFNDKLEIVALHLGSDMDVGSPFGLAFDAFLADATARMEGVQIAPDLAEAARTTADPDTDASTPDYFSVFISYSHDDVAFANRLYNALQASGIRAWLDRKNMRPGDDIYEEVQQGIQQWDKVLLCCSASSLSSWWVDSEIDRAFQKERDLWKARQGRVNALIPLMLDDFLLEKWTGGKAQTVKSRLAADFRDWQDDHAFEASLEDLKRALRADPGAREAPPESKL